MKETKQQMIERMMTVMGMTRSQAEFAAAIERGEIDGDVIAVDQAEPDPDDERVD